MLRFERLARADHLLQQRLERFFVEHAAVEERIDDDRITPEIRRAPLDAHQEMPRKTDAARRNADPLGDLAINERERDRDADAALEHVRKEAVLRVVIVGLVARETLPLVEVMR